MSAPGPHLVPSPGPDHAHESPLPRDVYRQAVARERRLYRDCLNVHELPPIFHYWSNRYIRPKLLPFGFDGPDGMFARYFEERCRDRPGRAKRFVSIGAGNCDLEIGIALHLRACAHESFTIDCVDLNPAMLRRGRLAAERAGVAGHLRFRAADFNHWAPDCSCDAVMANQSLHHVLNLEGLFRNVRRSLEPGGCFVISDIVGRNGHQRWPEALELVRAFWRLLPPSYRFNLKLGRYEHTYRDYDCSSEGFEGIRSQDILPLLLEHFHFRFFLPFGNLIDPFVDRCFGPHFDDASAWDTAFIDEVHQRDASELRAGMLTPTHMLAVVESDRRADPLYPENLPPEACVRRPGEVRRPTLHRPMAALRRLPPWPHDPLRQLEIVVEGLARKEEDALHLQEELRRRADWALDLERQLEERTAWALRLSRELKAADEVAAWANRLSHELESEAREVRRLQAELRAYLRHPLRFLLRVAGEIPGFIRRRLRRRNFSGH